MIFFFFWQREHVYRQANLRSVNIIQMDFQPKKTVQVPILFAKKDATLKLKIFAFASESGLNSE